MDRKLPRDLGMTINGAGEAVLCKRKPRGLNPKRGLALILFVFFGVKGLFYEQLGAITYQGRIASLEQGMMIERFGAKLMQADPVTLWVSEQIEKLRGPETMGLGIEKKPAVWSRLFSQQNLDSSLGSLKSSVSN